MAHLEFDRIVTGEELKGMVQKAFGSGFRLTLKKKRIEIVQDAAKGCVIQVREARGKTICKGPYGYMPSGGLRIAIILGAFVLLFLIGQAMGYLVIGIGALPMIVLVLIMKAPSQDLVKRVRGIVEKLTLEGADNSNASSMEGQLGDMSRKKIGSFSESIKVICPQCASSFGYDEAGKVYKCRHCGEIFRVGEDVQMLEDTRENHLLSEHKQVTVPNNAPEVPPPSQSTENASALVLLGKKYLIGQEVPQDFQEARKHFRLAADMGNADGQFFLGNMHDKGYGVLQDYKEALKWYRLAADQGHAIAQFCVGIFYRDGFGVPHDYNEAAKWTRLAAEQKYDVAQYNLGVMYYDGLGVAHNIQEAVIWWQRAADKGNANAKHKLSLVLENHRYCKICNKYVPCSDTSKMTPRQLASMRIDPTACAEVKVLVSFATSIITFNNPPDSADLPMWWICKQCQSTRLTRGDYSHNIKQMEMFKQTAEKSEKKNNVKKHKKKKRR
jgi:TPR repeat protein